MNRSKQDIPFHAVTTKELRAFGFDMMDLSDQSGKKYNSAVSHRHTYFELFLFNKKGGRHLIDFKEYPIEQNSLHFVSAGQIHKLEQKMENGLVICFTEDFIALKENGNFTDQFPFFDPGNTPVLKISKSFADEILALAKQLYTEFKKQGPGSTVILQSYLNIILIKIKAFYQSSDNNNGKTGERNAIVIKFKKLLEQWYTRHVETASYASELNVSANYLNQLCKRYEGRTASSMLQERLLLESKRLLYNSEFQIKEIAYKLNFEDVSYFNRFFKKKTGLTPLEFRNSSKA